jgi:hypothetical protein
MTYNYNAAWLLQSVYNAEREGNGADLRDVISVADYINHAIVSYQEFSSGLELLLKLGLVSQNGMQLSTSDDFKKWWKKAMKDVKRPFPHKEGKEIQKYLMELVQNFTGDREVRIDISEELLNAAISSYKKSSGY